MAVWVGPPAGNKGTGALEKAVGNDAPWAGEASLGRALTSMLMNLNLSPRLQEVTATQSKLPEVSLSQVS